jgi:hypothetical protein
VHGIKSNFGIWLDAPEKTFTIHTGQSDMSPGTMVEVKLKDADAKMVVWSYDHGIFRNLEIAYLVFSDHVEQRNIRDAKGRIFGTDRWDYLQSGERWRYVKFSTGDEVSMSLRLQNKQAS